ncbi:MAG: TOBE domain-containing protein [Acaryochloridaceae cyanobacterium RU_4_10]|nr:TOBE domain-containing protein [Acaryochloridaceae cyanobacterium RU_4_10]
MAPHPESVQDSAVAAKVERVIHLGWEIQIELLLPDNRLVNAHLTREQYGELALELGQNVFVRPKAAKEFAETVVEPEYYI